jgi:hypothetical protein
MTFSASLRIGINIETDLSIGVLSLLETILKVKKLNTAKRSIIAIRRAERSNRKVIFP